MTPAAPDNLPCSCRSGLYTSPHLVAVRERIRINSVPLSEEQFSSFFFEVWDRLEKNQEVCTDRTSPFFLTDLSRLQRALESTSPKPGYFRMVTLVAFHAFLSLGVCIRHVPVRYIVDLLGRLTPPSSKSAWGARTTAQT